MTKLRSEEEEEEEEEENHYFKQDWMILNIQKIKAISLEF